MDELQHFVDAMDPARHQRFDLSRRLYSRYIATLRDKTLGSELKRWVDGTIASLTGAHPEGRILAVTGESGTGKTWAIERAIDSVPGLKEATLCVTAPRPCTLKQLGRTILKDMGYELRRDLYEHIVWEKVRDHLEGNGLRFLWIDELQHTLASKGDPQVAAISDTFKNLVQRRSWPVSFLLSGLPVVSSFLGRDRQIERRSRTLEFGPLVFPGSAGLIRNALLTTIVETDAGMRLGDLATDEFIHRLCHATGGALGVVIDLIRSAVLQAAERTDFSGSILVGDFAAAYAAERNCERSENVFLSPRWHEIWPENSRLRVDSTREGN
jgi:hypothetical protein